MATTAPTTGIFDNIGATVNTGLNDFVATWFDTQTASLTDSPIPVASQPVPAVTVAGFSISPMLIAGAALLGLIVYKVTR